MPIPRAKVIQLSEREERMLEAIERQSNAPQWLVKRSALILKASSGATSSSIAAATGQRRDTVQRWRDRWYASQGEREQAENDKALRQVIEQTLTDAPRRGAPATFSAEQIVQIVALACEVPEASGYPLSHYPVRWPRRPSNEELSSVFLSARWGVF